MNRKNSLLYRLYCYKAFGYKYIDEGFLLDEEFDCFEDMKSLQKELLNCNLCLLCKSRNKVLMPSGNEKAKLMVILESPSISEDADAKPFCGNLGERLLSLIEEKTGLKKDDFYTSFLIKCKIPQNSKIQSDTIIKCAPYIFDEIRLVNPGVIVTFGEIVSKIVLKNENLPDLLVVHGSVFKENSTYIIPTFDIRHIATNPSKMKFLLEDLTKIKELL